MNTISKSIFVVLASLMLVFFSTGNPQFFLNGYSRPECQEYTRVEENPDGSHTWYAMMCFEVERTDQRAIPILNMIDALTPKPYQPFAEGLLTNLGINFTMHKNFNANFTGGPANADDFMDILAMGNISRTPAVTDDAASVNDCAAQSDPNLCEVVSCGGERAQATAHIPVSIAGGTGVIRLENTFNIDCILNEVSAGMVFTKATASASGDVLVFHSNLTANATLIAGDTLILRADITIS